MSKSPVSAPGGGLTLGNGFVRRQIERCTRNLQWVNALIVLGVLAAGGLCWRYLYNFAKGPFPATRQQVLETKDWGARGEYFISFEADEVQQVARRVKGRSGGSGREVGVIDVLRLGDRLLLASFEKAPPTNRVSGVLVPVPAKMEEEVLSPIEKREPEVARMLLPLMLDGEDFRFPGYVGLGIGIPLFLVGLVNVIRSVRFGSNPALHPVARRLAALGSATELAMGIDSEASASLAARTAKKPFVMQSWVVAPEFFNLKVVRLPDVVWLYKRVVQHRTNFIPTGKTFAAILCTRDGRVTEIGGREKDVDEVLKQSAERVPWAATGHSPEIEAAWNRQRAEFLAAVDKRRAERA